ncbi:hypothetical protein PR202_gb12879 [Eleusine coracana subsp. coracana]|uniref:Uncharacterized protein n=1 Tax=Eleusine coracana subsp. coracana TaxID=191504 RepID=A0AAV5ERL8_ELECO|nr:hypothetical protein PR202_gb12879 [Eleusine coracana subsp. coracana]
MEATQAELGPSGGESMGDDPSLMSVARGSSGGPRARRPTAPPPPSTKPRKRTFITPPARHIVPPPPRPMMPPPPRQSVPPPPHPMAPPPPRPTVPPPRPTTMCSSLRHQLVSDGLRPVRPPRHDCLAPYNCDDGLLPWQETSTSSPPRQEEAPFSTAVAWDAGDAFGSTPTPIFDWTPEYYGNVIFFPPFRSNAFS